MKNKFLQHWKALLVALLIVAIIPVTIFAAGSNTNTVQYNALNKSVKGTYVEPTREGYEFVGWATTKEKADAGQVDFNGNPEDLTNTSLNSIKKDETKHVYAVWASPAKAKYAVAIYGIDVDTAKQDGGNYAHTITFGPATGGNYVTSSKKAHVDKSAETPDNKCIHNHTWAEIIADIKAGNEHAYDQCVTNNCTATVELTINKTLRSTGWTNSLRERETGDGPSFLYYELQDQWKVWQPGTGSGTYQYGDNTGGWPATRIRAMLNGTDLNTDLTRANRTYIYSRSNESTSFSSSGGWGNASVTDISTINSNNALISCFPTDLKNGIVPKAVKSDTVYYNTSGNNVTTYDKLWLFSTDEIGFSRRPNEKAGDYTRSFSNNSRVGYSLGDNSTWAGNSGGSSYRWWLRSAGRDDSSSAYSVSYDGNWSSDGTGYSGRGVAPGFVVGN